MSLPRAAALALAALLCGCASNPGLKPFSSDGCSAFPDGNYCKCCYVHDQIYWRGGTAEERKTADLEFRECLGRYQDGSLPALMYYGTRVGGHPAWPFPWRWGYGWPWGRGYQPLSDAERPQAEAQLSQVPQAYPGQVCGVP